MSHAVVETLGWALIHSLWECAAAALLFALFQLFARSANVRYIAGCLTMLAMLAAPTATFVALTKAPAGRVAIAATAISPSADQAAPILQTGVLEPARPTAAEPRYLAMVVWLWMIGVIALSLWEAGAWLVAQRLKRRTKRPLPQAWVAHVSTLCARMRVRRAVAVYESAIAKVPAVIGCLRPVILIPAAALMNLSARELEAVLAHELAHIRRFDYLANLVQTAIETLLFYHPAVWWVGRRVRAEREHCCDDMAVAVCGDRLVYARALTSLEEIRGAAPQLAMAATGGALSHRIHRLLGARQPLRRNLPLWILGVVTLVVSIILVGNTRAARANGPAPAARAALPAPAATPAPNLPEMPQPTPHPVTPATPEAAAPAAPAAPPVFAPPAPSPTPAPEAPVLNAPQPSPMPHMPYAAGPAGQTPTPPPPAAVAAAPQTPGPVTALASHRGFLAGLADAGYTSISVDDIIALKQNGVSPSYIKSMLQAGFSGLTPRDLIDLHANGVPPEYARAAKASGVRDLKVQDVIHLRQNGVRSELLDALAAAGYRDVTVAQIIDAQNNGLSGSALRSVREQGFKNLTLEQVIKLKRAGVI